MKICFIGGAISIHTKKRVKWFAEKGIDVHLISPTSASIEGITLYKIGKKDGSFINFLRKIIQTRKFVKKIQPNILVADYAFGYGTFAAYTNFHPFVIRCMGSDIGTGVEKSFVQKIVVKFALKKADMVSVVDECAKKRAIELGCKKERIIIRPSYCDTKFFSPKKYSEKIRKELGINDKPSVLFTRNIGRKYKTDVLRNAIPKVVREIPNIRFIIIEKGDLVNEFKEFFKSNNLQKNIVFIPPISNADMAKYLASVDLYVDTFYSEYEVGGHGHGTNTIEAMSCGCPQLLPDREEYKESWFHAILYKKGDSKDMADKMVILLKNNNLRTKIGKDSRESAISFADEENVMNKTLIDYNRLINQYKVKK